MAVLSLKEHVPPNPQSHAGVSVAAWCLVTVVLLVLVQVVTDGVMPEIDFGVTTWPLLAAAALSIAATGIALRDRRRA